MSKLLDVFRNNVLMHMGDRSQRWLSQTSGVNQGSLSQLLSGQGNPSLETIEALAKALDVTPATLLGGTDGKVFNVPKDILDLLENETPTVYDTIRLMLKTLKSQRKK